MTLCVSGSLVLIHGGRGGQRWKGRVFFFFFWEDGGTIYMVKEKGWRCGCVEQQAVE
jgi:hypothetical protein